MAHTSIQFFNLKDASSDWRLNCPKHGNVTDVILKDGDVKNGLCQLCWFEDVARGIPKCTFNANGGPEPTGPVY